MTPDQHDRITCLLTEELSTLWRAATAAGAPATELDRILTRRRRRLESTIRYASRPLGAAR